MSDPYIAEIRIVGFNFPPVGWATCDGQLMAISQNTALFSILGTNFGGNGTSNFGLPNFQGNTPMGTGDGPGLTPRNVGESGGVATVSLLLSEIPAHNHSWNATDDNQALVQNPGNELTARPTGSNIYAATGTKVNMVATSITGGNLPHNNLQPYLVMLFIICLVGVFPARP
jgi:microcystin-dependent protein